jgi:MFS family permease
MFLTGAAAFTAASALCGLAWAAPVLVIARTAQGVTAGLMVPQVLTLIQLQATGPRHRVVAAAGQFLGGVLVAANLAASSWRAVFLVNVPVGIAVWAAGQGLLPRPRPGGAMASARARIDPIRICLRSVSAATARPCRKRCS